ncbi:MAG: NAD-dependent epimerase/dehydratase family protein [Alphaproteobacteria bacterium]|nr:NAD-dependent epimerase/dehydratase family protein [Alphaproteobacteria bacterium]
MILVTGGAGFIGAHTVAHLVGAGHAVRVLDDLSTGRASRLDGLGVELVEGDVTDDDAVSDAIVGVSHVIHLAARVSVPESVADPAAYHATNTGGLLTVLTHARAAGVARVVYASSCAVYGSLPGLPKSEDDPVAPESPYAATKLANEAYGRAWAALGLSTVGLRYFNVFGPGQDPRGPYGAVIPTFVSRALAGQPLVIHGDGTQGRDFVAVADVARANACAALAPSGAGVDGAVVNIGTGTMLSVGALAARVADLVPGTTVVHGPARVGDVHLSCGDVRRAAERLGWTATADFDAALDATLRAFGA